MFLSPPVLSFLLLYLFEQSKRGKHTERYRLLLHPFGLYISLYYIWVVCGSNPDLHLLALLDVCPTLLICASSDLLLHRRLLPSFLSQSATPVAPYYMTNSFTSSFWSGSVLHGSHTRLVDVLFLLGSHIFQPRAPVPRFADSKKFYSIMQRRDWHTTQDGVGGRVLEQRAPQS